MASQKTLKVFKKFLEKHDAYDAYCEAMRDRYNDILEKLMSTSNPYNYVGGFFSWSNTVMKEDYWSDLDDDWSMFLKHNKYLT